ncbi:MAG: anti-sigma factor family protein [Actinomycetota bacterium]
MNPIDHERYSERLSGYVRGELGPEETEEIRAHLLECPMCRHEEAALIALSAAPIEGLSGEESERLHATVMAEIADQPKLAVAPSQATSPPPRRSWAPRVAQFMAAAAVIALATIYLTNPEVSPFGGADRGEPAAGRVSEEGGADEERFEGAGGEGGDTVEAAQEPITDAEGNVVGSEAGADRGTEGERGNLQGTTSAGSGGGDAGREGDEETAIAAPLKANPLSLGVGAAYRGRI